MKDSGPILVIDDDVDLGEFIAAAVLSTSLRCTVITDASALVAYLTPEPYLILLDLQMPGMDGIEVLRKLGELHCTVGIVLMSGIGRRVIETAEKLAVALHLNVVGHLNKPFRLAELERVLHSHTAHSVLSDAQRVVQPPITDDDLRLAVERNQFVLHYQPQIDIPTGNILGVEGLARWIHPDRGLIFPDLFIDRIETLRIMVPFGWLIVERGLSDLVHLAPESDPPLRVSLNASVSSLSDLRFPDVLISCISKYGIAPERLMLEITETGLIKEPSQTLDVLTRLRMKQIQLSIDDFGTGYAMMEQLRNIPATELKIDRSLVQTMHLNHSDRVLVRKIIEMAHELGIEVLAEGVETLDQLNSLRLDGCDSAQGYLFSRPLPPDKMARWIENYRYRQSLSG